MLNLQSLSCLSLFSGAKCGTAAVVTGRILEVMQLLYKYKHIHKHTHLHTQTHTNRFLGDAYEKIDFRSKNERGNG